MSRLRALYDCLVQCCGAGAHQEEDGGAGLVDQDQAEEEDDGETDGSGDCSSEPGNYGDDESDVAESVGDGDDDEEDEDQSQPEPAL